MRCSSAKKAGRCSSRNFRDPDHFDTITAITSSAPGRAPLSHGAPGNMSANSAQW